MAAVVVSIWWSTRLRRPAAPLVIEDVSTEELREAVAEGRSALAGIDDARAAIIACYVAMERSLADRGTARGAADTPDELLGRAVASGAVRGGAAGRLTALFYEARFSTHPLGAGQRDAASAALDELAGELAVRPAPAAASPPSAAGEASAAGQAGRWLGMNWRPALPELIIAAIMVVAAALASAAVAGWPGVVIVAAATAVIALLLLRGIIPRSAAERLRRPKDKQRAGHLRLRAAPVHRRHQPQQPPAVRVGPEARP